MKYTVADFTIPAVLYSLEVYKTDLSEKDITAIRNALWYYRKQFPDISFFFGVSMTDSATASRQTIRTGKRGRPRVVIEGKKKDVHVHIGAMGKSKYQESAYPFLNRVKVAVDKRLDKNVKNSKVVGLGTHVHAINFIGYAYRQCKPFEHSGGFDFGYYYKDITGFYNGN